MFVSRHLMLDVEEKKDYLNFNKTEIQLPPVPKPLKKTSRPGKNYRNDRNQTRRRGRKARKFHRGKSTFSKKKKKETKENFEIHFGGAFKQKKTTNLRKDYFFLQEMKETVSKMKKERDTFFFRNKKRKLKNYAKLTCRILCLISNKNKGCLSPFFCSLFGHRRSWTF